MREPEGPWFVNVTHMRAAGRPLCCSPVDYNHAKWSEDWSEVDCAACHRERPSAEKDAVHEVRRAMRALYTTVPAEVARDVAERVESALAQAWDEGANAAVEPYNAGTRMTLRARIPFPADENPYVLPPGVGLPNCEGWTCQSCGADNFVPAGFARVLPPGGTDDAAQ